MSSWSNQLNDIFQFLTNATYKKSCKQFSHSRKMQHVFEIHDQNANWNSSKSFASNLLIIFLYFKFFFRFSQSAFIFLADCFRSYGLTIFSFWLFIYWASFSSLCWSLNWVVNLEKIIFWVQFLFIELKSIAHIWIFRWETESLLGIQKSAVSSRAS